MSTSPQEFISKNMKWFALAFLCLFLFKCTQSCTQNMNFHTKERHYLHEDSAKNNLILNLSDSIKNIKWENRILQTKVESEKSKSDGMRSVAEKYAQKNTTIINNIPTVKGDTIKRK